MLRTNPDQALAAAPTFLNELQQGMQLRATQAQTVALERANKRAAQAEESTRKGLKALGITDPDLIEKGVQATNIPDPTLRKAALAQLFPDLSRDKLTDLRVRDAQLKLRLTEDKLEAVRLAMEATGISNGTLALAEYNRWLAKPNDPEEIERAWLRYRITQQNQNPGATEQQVLEQFAVLHPADADEIGFIAGRVQVPDIIVATLDGAIQDAKTAGFSKGRALKDVLDNIDILIDNKRVPLPPGIVGTATQQLAADKRFRKQLKAAVRIMFSFAWDEVVPRSPIDQQLQQQQ